MSSMLTGVWDYPADWRESQRRWDRKDPRASSPYTDPPINPPTTTREPTMTITPGELRARTQPTILLRMTAGVDAAPGNTDGPGKVFLPGDVVFAQYVGNGRLLLTPVQRQGMTTGPQVVMASALNSTAEIIKDEEMAAAFHTVFGKGAK